MGVCGSCRVIGCASMPARLAVKRRASILEPRLAFGGSAMTAAWNRPVARVTQRENPCHSEHHDLKQPSLEPTRGLQHRSVT